jgi:hypothetical protein
LTAGWPRTRLVLSIFEEAYMNPFNRFRCFPRCIVVLAIVLAGVLAAGAAAAVLLTIDRNAQLSPGRLHATLTGTVTCDAGSTAELLAQIVQSNTATGFGRIVVPCEGTSQSYTIDVGAVADPYKSGQASAQVSMFACSEGTCTSTSTDAIIHLKK